MTAESETIVRLFVEKSSDELMIEGMFADHVQNGCLTVKMCWTTSSAISLAESWLLTSETTPVALVFDCAAEPREFRVPIENILSRAGGRERWHVALAIPRVTDWLLLDPKFAEAVEQSKVPLSTNPDMAVFFKDWVKQSGHQFDRDEVSKRNREFAALNHFLEAKVLSATGAKE